MDNSDIRLLYVTAPDVPTARTLAGALVEAKLAACVNILPGMLSVYQWQGDIQHDEEVVMLVKTTNAAASAARDLILQKHPYDTPAALSLPVDGAGSSPAFIEWIAKTCDT